jgi:hypothetical protein
MCVPWIWWIYLPPFALLCCAICSLLPRFLFVAASAGPSTTRTTTHMDSRIDMIMASVRVWRNGSSAKKIFWTSFSLACVCATAAVGCNLCAWRHPTNQPTDEHKQSSRLKKKKKVEGLERWPWTHTHSGRGAWTTAAERTKKICAPNFLCSSFFVFLTQSIVLNPSSSFQHQQEAQEQTAAASLRPTRTMSM